MKKYLGIIFLTILVITITGCKKSNGGFNIKTDSSSKQDKLIIESESTVETIYSDIYKEDSNEIFTIDKKETYKDEKCKSKGCKVKVIYTIKGIKEGRSTFLVKKYNLKDKKIIETIAYDISVDKDLKITENHSSVKNGTTIVIPSEKENCKLTIENFNNKNAKINIKDYESNGNDSIYTKFIYIKGKKSGEISINYRLDCDGNVFESSRVFKFDKGLDIIL